MATPQSTTPREVTSQDHPPIEQQIDEKVIKLQKQIMIAVQCGYEDILDRVYKRLPKFNFSFTYTVEGKKSRYTPLLYACICNQANIAKWLLSKRVNTNQRTELRETALILAVSNEKADLNLIHELLLNGKQNLGAQNKHKLTALHIACINGHSEVVEILLKCNNDWTTQGNTKIIGKKEMKTKTDNTPFMMAVKGSTPNHKKIVRMWLEMEREPSMILRPVCDDVNERGFNAVMIAAHTGQLDCLKIMEECSAITDDISKLKTKKHWNIIHCAAASGSLDTLEWLLSWRDGILKTGAILNAPTEKGYTPFLTACEYQHFEIVEYLMKLEDIVEIDAMTKDGMTALHLAAKHDAVDIVDLLLKHGRIGIDTQEKKNGNTVLHIATLKSSLRVEERLKNDPDYKYLEKIENNNEQTADNLRTVHIPLEIRKRGKESIDAYLKALSEGQCKNSHYNLIVLGEARVGKTSLIKSILHEDFDPDSGPTKGVILDQSELAESVDIRVPESQEEAGIWKLENSLERVKKKYIDSVANAVAKVAAPVNSSQRFQKCFDKVDHGTLLDGVDKIVTQIVRRQRRQVSKNKPKPISYPKNVERPPLPAPEPAPKRMFEIPPSLPQRPKTVPPSSISQSQKSKESSQPKPAELPDDIRDDPADILGAEDDSLFHISGALSYEESIAIGKQVKNPRKQQDHDLTFHTIDFAGQSLYRPMHHCFITSRAVYLVVFKLTEIFKYIKSKTDPMPVCEIRYWLNNIIAHGSDPDADDDEYPRIFLVGTHRNGDAKCGMPAQLSDNDLQEVDAYLSSIFVDDVKERRYETSIQRHEQNCTTGKFIFCIENSLSKNDRANSGIVILMKQIRNLSKNIPFLAKEIPTSYMKFETKLLEMKKERKKQPLTTRKEVESWAKECGIVEEAGIATVIQFFHDIRVIVDQTLISCPFKLPDQSPKPISSVSTILLSPQWLGDVMRTIVEMEIPVSSKSKFFKHYGIIHRADLMKCFSDSESLQHTDTVACSNLLEILQSHCLIYLLSTLHCDLLGLKPGDAHLTEGNYLIPIKLPTTRKIDSEKLRLVPDSYEFEFDFQSYLPAEVYVHTICYFLNMIKDFEGPGKFDHDYVVLTDCCSKFMYVKLENLPKAHWTIKMNKDTQTLIFNVVPLKKEHSFRPSQFIVAVAKLMLTKVCSHGSLGHLNFKGGPKARCSNGKEILLSFVSSDMNSPDIESATVICPHCNIEEHDINNILSKMVTNINHESSLDTSTVFASSTGIDYKFITRTSRRLCNNKVICPAHLAKLLGVRKEWKAIMKEESDAEDQLYDVLEAWFNKDLKHHTKEKLRENLNQEVHPDMIKVVFDNNGAPLPNGTDSMIHSCAQKSNVKKSCDILQEHYDDLVELVADPIRLANGMWSAKLISDQTKKYAHTVGIPDYKKSSDILSEFYSFICSKDSECQRTLLMKFCDVLVKQDSPALNSIAEQIKREMELL